MLSNHASSVLVATVAVLAYYNNIVDCCLAVSVSPMHIFGLVWCLQDIISCYAMTAGKDQELSHPKNRQLLPLCIIYF